MSVASPRHILTAKDILQRMTGVTWWRRQAAHSCSCRAQPDPLLRAPRAVHGAHLVYDRHAPPLNTLEFSILPCWLLNIPVLLVACRQVAVDYRSRLGGRAHQGTLQHAQVGLVLLSIDPRSPRWAFSSLGLLLLSIPARFNEACVLQHDS